MSGNLGDVNLVLGIDDAGIKKAIDELNKKLNEISKVMEKAVGGASRKGGVATSGEATPYSEKSLTAALDALKQIRKELADGQISQDKYNKKIKDWAKSFKEAADIADVLGVKLNKITAISSNNRQALAAGTFVPFNTAQQLQEAMKLSEAYMNQSKVDSKIWKQHLENYRRYKEEFAKASGRSTGQVTAQAPEIKSMEEIYKMSTVSINALKAQRVELLRLRDAYKGHPEGLGEINRALQVNMNAMKAMRAQGTEPLVRSLANIKAMSTQTRLELVAQEKELRRLLESMNRNQNPKAFAQVRQELMKNKEAQMAYSLSLQQSNRHLDEMKGLVARAFSIYAIRNFINKMVEVRGEFEIQQRSLQAILQNKAKADEIWQKNVTLALKSPFRLREVVRATRELAAYRVEQDKLYETNKMLMDISAGLGVEMSRLILAYGQVRSASVLRGQELRQFTEAGIPLVKALADEFSNLEGKSVSVASVFDRISKRQVPFEMINKIFKDMTQSGGIFYNMQEIQAETLKGKVSNLKDAMDVFYNTVGKDNEGTLKFTVDALRGMLDVMADILPVIYGVISATVAYRISVMLLSASLKIKAKALGYSSVQALLHDVAMKKVSMSAIKGAVSINIFTSALNRLKIAWATNPIGIVVSGVLLAIGVFSQLTKETDNSVDALERLRRAQQDSYDASVLYESFERGYQKNSREVAKLREELSRLTKGTDEYNDKAAQVAAATTRMEGSITALAKAHPKAAAAIEKTSEGLSINLEVLKDISEKEEKLVRNRLEARRIAAEEQVRLLEKEREGIIAEFNLTQRWMERLNDSVGDKKVLDKLRKALSELDSDLSGVNTRLEEFYEALRKIKKESGDVELGEVAVNINKLIESLRGSFPDSMIDRLVLKKDVESLEDFNKNIGESLEAFKEKIETYNRAVEAGTADKLFDADWVKETLKEYELLKRVARMTGFEFKTEKGDKKDPVADKVKRRIKLYEEAAKAYEKYLQVFDKGAAKQRVIDEFGDLFGEFGEKIDFDKITSKGLADQYIRAIKELSGRGTDQAKEALRSFIGSLADLNVNERADEISKLGDAFSELFDDVDRFQKFKKSTGLSDDVIANILGVTAWSDDAFQKHIESTIEYLSKGGEKEIELAKKLKKRLDDIRQDELTSLFEFRDKYMDYEAQILKIKEDAAAERARIEKGRAILGDATTDATIRGILEAAARDIAAVRLKEFKDSPIWSKLFDDLSRVSSSTLDQIYEKASEYVAKFAGDLTPQALKEIMSALSKAREEIANRSPFEQIGKQWTKLAKLREKYNKAVEAGADADTKSGIEDEMTEAYDDLAKSLSGIMKLYEETEDILNNLADAISLVDENAGGIVRSVTTAISGLVQMGAIMTEVVAKTKLELTALETASVVLLAIKAAVIATQLILKAFSAKDNAIKRQIEEAEKSVTRLERAYARLEKEKDKAFDLEGNIKALSKMAVNTMATIQAINRQIALEESRGKKRDNSAIEELLEQRSEIYRRAAEEQEKWLEELGAIDIKSAAEEFVDAWLDAFRNAEDGMDAMMAKYDEMIINMVKRQAALRIVSKLLKPIDDFIDEALSDSILTPDELQKLNNMGSIVVQNIAAQLKAFFESFDYSEGFGQEASGLQKSISSITEDTAQIMTAYLNSIRYKLFEVSADFASMSESMIVNNAIASESLAYLGDMVTLLREMRQWQDAISSFGHPKDGGKGLRVFV